MGLANVEKGTIVSSSWAAPRFSDREIAVNSCCRLHNQVLVQDLLRSPIAKPRMKTLPIITDLDVPSNVIPRLIPSRVDCTVNELELHRSVELHDLSIIDTYTSVPNRLTHTVTSTHT